ncbi:MAG TPA: tetratricopeptide repeat protein [Bacteroidota bacterium]|nr:tetratricopeptide repeat protein [Bacteroidota bacterium]
MKRSSINNKAKPALVPDKTFERRDFAALIAILIGFFAHTQHFLFIQDDSFITFRYIRNFVAGKGLVWNVGERVEGYTSFLWTILLSVPAKLGLDLTSVAQNFGLATGLATVYLLYRFCKEFRKPDQPFGFTLIAPILLVANSAVAYWTISGMETALFSFLTLLAIWLYLKERGESGHAAYIPLVFVFLSLTRPEGILLFAVTIVHAVVEVYKNKIIHRQNQIKRIAVWIAVYILCIGGYMIWRLSYYGYMFPNTFYAKVGFSLQSLGAGIRYFYEFAANYLLWGVLIVPPFIILMKRKLSREMIYLSLIVLSYISSTILIGGDVLPAFRFFVPLVPLLYLLVQQSLFEAYRAVREKKSTLKNIILIVPLLLAYITYRIPYDYVRASWVLEKGLVSKMTEVGKWINANSTSTTIVAASTIGALGYYSDVTMVDMLGLTDEVIAHDPENIEGLESSWKERHYNVSYVLSRRPDWICFSTGIKPSAFAERGLFTQDEFLRWYYPYRFHPTGDFNKVTEIFKRSDTPLSKVLSDVRGPARNAFVNQFYEGTNLADKQPGEAIRLFQQAMETSPDNFGLLYESLGDLYWALNKHKDAYKSYTRAVQIDPRLTRSQIVLGILARDNKEYEVAKTHFELIVKYDPHFSLGWSLLADTYFLTGDVQKAKEYYEKALQIAPNNLYASSHLRQIGKGR